MLIIKLGWLPMKGKVVFIIIARLIQNKRAYAVEYMESQE